MGSDNDLSKGAPGFVNLSRRVADDYLVPDGPDRDVLLQLGALLDGEFDGFAYSVIDEVHRQMADSVRAGGGYRPHSLLEAQLEYEKARKDLEAQGITTPACTEDDDAFVLDRWGRWRDR